LDSVNHADFVNFLTVIIAIAITIYFWRLNVIGMHESSDKALRIMQLTTVMGVLIVGWSFLTLFMHHTHISAPPLHPVFTQSSMDPGKEESSMGWLEAFPKLVGTIGILVAFGHSLLAMSGEESRGPGEPGNPGPETEESASRRLCDLPVFDAADQPDQLFGGSDYPRSTSG